MVRATIACAHCRKSKIKCIHDGTSPCHRCAKRGPSFKDQCILARPVITWKKHHCRSELGRHEDGQTQRPSSDRDRAQVTTTPPEIGSVLAASLFVANFPELAFLHIPMFSQRLKELEQAGLSLTGTSKSRGMKFRGLCSAILALCGSLMGHECDQEGYASFSRSIVTETISPGLVTVQTCLVLCMYECGQGRSYRAWVYSGMAIRMIQLLRKMYNTDLINDSQREILNRTFWGCFILDRMILCGTPQPLAFPLETVDEHWPIGQRDFTFGKPSFRRFPNNPSTDEFRFRVDMDDYYAQLVKGFDIWAGILRWIVDGGRRRPELCAERGVVWAERSKWRSFYTDLQEWRNAQDGRLHFPETPVESHVSLGHGQAFVYLNLIYHISRLFLGREYIPFIPTPISEPSGPVEPPLLPNDSPAGWWEERSYELFTSASYITDLLRRLENTGTPFATPFTGFCAFSAATMNIYVCCFPRMNLGRSSAVSASDVESNLTYLDQFRDKWPMGNGWWTTIKQVQTLYGLASRRHPSFTGKTRADYVALHVSMHDCAGISLPDGASNSDLSEEEEEQQDSFPVLYPDNPVPAHVKTQLTTSTARIQDQTHASTWPTWGEQQGPPFAIDGVPWDYNLNAVLFPTAPDDDGFPLNNSVYDT
ncbi:hypothetical protein V8C42DRAFT_361304 [Trichoderma barbatum]